MQEVEWRGEVFEFSDSATEDQIKNFLRNKKAERDYDFTNLARQAAQGATFNFSDEIEAGVRASLSDQTYQDIVTDVRKQQDVFARKNPGTALTANILGGLTVPGLGVTAGLTKALPAVGTLGKTIIAGASSGALSGLGAGEGIGDSLKQSAFGGLLGGIAGPVVSYGAKGIGLGLKGAFGGLAKATDSIDGKVSRVIADNIDKDGLTLDKIKTRLTNFPGTSLMDVAGSNTLGLARNIAQQPGRGSNNIHGFLKNRLRSTQTRIATMAEKLHPQARNIDIVKESIENTRHLETGDLYNQAHEIGLQNPAAMISFIENPVIKKKYLGNAITESLGDVRYPLHVKKFTPIPQADGKKDISVPPLVVFANIKAKLKYDIDRAVEKGHANEASRLDALRAELIKKLDKQAPLYRKADALYEEYSRDLSAMDLGASAFDPTSKLYKDAFNRKVKKLTPRERDFLKIGAADKMLRIIDDAQEDINGLTKTPLLNALAGSKTRRNALRQVYGDDIEGLNEFKRSLLQEKKYRNTYNQATGNSTTFVNQAFEAAKGVDPNFAVDVASAINLNPTGIIATAKGLFTNQKAKDELNEKIAKKFTTSKIDEIFSTLKDVQNKTTYVPKWVGGITTQDKLKAFMRDPDNATLVNTFISRVPFAGATGATVGDYGYEPTVIPITRGRNE